MSLGSRGRAAFASGAVLSTSLALFFALAVGAIMFACLGADPLRAYAVMARGALCSGYALGEVLVKAAPLILTGLAVALARTMLLWNI
ncbi:MAG: hypothetical protein PHV85_10260, partial [Desulfovibrionaceae bacterium]|nr:hypothetical protein [Desulfovibrionaceae bacterium]